MSDEKIRVLIVDDGESMRRALRMRLADQPDITVVGEAGTASEAVQQVMAYCPDVNVAIVSCTAPGMDYVEVVESIKRECDGLGIVVLAPYEETTERALKAGAGAHLLKETDIGVVTDAIRLVAAGHRISPNRRRRLPIRRQSEERGPP